MTTDDLIEAYMSGQPDRKRAELGALHRRIRAISPDAMLWFFDGIDESGKTVSNPSIGYGSKPIRYANRKTRDFYAVGLSANTVGISGWPFDSLDDQC